jgi:hypothetical protein
MATRSKSYILRTAQSTLDKRVAVAKDVLKLIRQKKIIPESGTYFKALPPLTQPEVGNLKTLGELRDKTKTKEHCLVCAQGACLYALANGVKPTKTAFKDELFWTEDALPWKKAKRIFGKTLWCLLEYIFEDAECSTVIDDEYIFADDKYVRDWIGCRDSEQTLRLLMTNIIRNKGRLVIPAAYSYTGKPLAVG